MARSVIDVRPQESSARSAVAFSAARCIVTYVVLPLAGPLLGLSGRSSTLVTVALILPGLLLSARTMRQGWRSERDRILLVGAALCTLNLLALVSRLAP